MIINKKEKLSREEFTVAFQSQSVNKMKIKLSDRMIEYLKSRGIEGEELVEEVVNDLLESWLDSKMTREEVKVIKEAEA